MRQWKNTQQCWNVEDFFVSFKESSWKNIIESASQTPAERQVLQKPSSDKPHWKQCSKNKNNRTEIAYNKQGLIAYHNKILIEEKKNLKIGM